MKKIITLIALGSILISCGSSSKTTTNNSNDLASQTVVKTAMDLTQVINDKIPVSINPGRFTTDKVTYRLPKVVQGTYSVSDFGTYIDDFKAFDYKGNEIITSKSDTNTWVISNAKNLDKITYLVNDTFDVEGEGGIGKEVPFSPAGTNIEDGNFVLNLHGFIGYFDSLKNNQYSLDVTSATNIKRTSALQETGSKINGETITTSYFAPRYFDITDNPMMYGNLEVEDFMVGSVKIVLSVFSPNKTHTAKGIKETVYKMMEAQKKYLGDLNTTNRYDIYLYLADMTNPKSPKGFGALEHHTSTVVVLPEQMPAPALAKAMTDVVAHEFFHVVTPLSVHSGDVHYFDYNDPTFSKHLWMYEGVTEYFAQHFQVYEGLVTEEEYLNTMMGKIQAASGMNDAMSFTKMSENILNAPYADQYLNVYQKGALIGMCIDIMMREESNGTRGMLSLMKELSSKYGKDKPFDDDKIIDEIVRMTYPSLRGFFDNHVSGNTPINYNAFFEKVGLEMAESKVETNYIQNDGALIVQPNKESGTITFNGLVAQNSFWNKAGAKEGDIIKTIDGTEVNLGSANQVFSQVFMWQPGKDVVVKLERDGKEVLIETKLEQSFTTGKKLQVKTNATKTQNDLRASWLKG